MSWNKDKYPNDIPEGNWLIEDAESIRNIQSIYDEVDATDETLDEEDGILLDDMFAQPEYDPENDGTIDWSRPHCIEELKKIWAFRPLHKVPVETHEWLDKIKYSVANADNPEDLYKWKFLEEYRDKICYDKTYRECKTLKDFLDYDKRKPEDFEPSPAEKRASQPDHPFTVP